MLLHWDKRLRMLLGSSPSSNVYGVLFFALYACIFVPLLPLGIATDERLYRDVQILTLGQLVFFFCGLIVSFLLIVHFIQHVQPLTTKSVLLLIAVAAIPFLFVYPGDSADFFANIWYAKRIVDFGDNPYVLKFIPEVYTYIKTVLPLTSESPYLPYGPLWLALQSSLYLFVRNFSLIPLIFFFKCVQLSGVLLTAWITMLLGKQFVPSETANKYVTAVCVSPFMLFGFIGSGHNDIWMVFLVILSLYLLFQKKILFGLLVFSASVFVKYISIIYAPFIALYVLFMYKRSAIKPLMWWILCSMIAAILLEINLHFSLGILEQTGITSFSLVQIFELFASSTQPAMIAKALMSAIFILAYFALLITSRYEQTLNSPTKLLQTLAAVTALFFMFFIHLWAYWYLVWFIPFIFLLDYKKYMSVIGVTILLIVNYLGGWKLYVLYIEKSISVLTLAIYLSTLIGVTFIVTTIILIRTFVVPEWKDRRKYLI